MESGLQEFLFRALAIGVGATVVLDLWAAFAGRVLAMPGPNWGLVGRWIGHFPKGQFVQSNIAAAEPVAGEKIIGWGAHYGIGVAFAGLLLALAGPDWARAPSLWPALLTGVATVAAPFFIMQPGMGMGIAASRTPRPALARARSLLTHSIFGLGLYLAALATARLG